jgi:hypothetical protein
MFARFECRILFKSDVGKASAGIFITFQKLRGFVIANYKVLVHQTYHTDVSAPD